MARHKKMAMAAALLASAAAGTQAAGGHHAVDDASILARGQCEQESWLTLGQGRQRLLHAGLNCGAGPIELGLAADHARDPGQASQTQWVLEAKWARELAQGFSVGADVQPIRQANSRPHYAGTTAYAIATWAPRDTLALHLNFGRDFVRGGPGQPRAGLAVEWLPVRAWSFLAERYRERDSHFVRTGPRWAGGHRWALDFSRAQRIAGPGPSNWTLGLTLALGAD